MHVLSNGAGPLYPAEIFNANELPPERTFELPRTSEIDSSVVSKQQTCHRWQTLGNFPNTIDYFGDGSLYVIDTPGHLLGHINLLARSGPDRWVYLGGDCCHDTRILHGQSGIAMYDDGRGGQRSVHMNTDAARSSLDRVRDLTAHAGDAVEMVIAHDLEWAKKNEHRFFPGRL
jgi:glyoxylase-like metal-dependent hydrolase (beta-lactamase superfamily II)